MPKLPSKAAQAAKAAAEGSGFAPLEPGTYEARLTSVEGTVTGPNSKTPGTPMWKWELEVVEEPYRGRKLWVNTVLSDAAMWKLGEMFAAFNSDTDADTEDLIGEHCLATVSIQTITGGARAGQPGNNVDRCEPLAGGAVGNEAAVAAGVAPAGETGDPGW